MRRHLVLVLPVLLAACSSTPRDPVAEPEDAGAQRDAGPAHDAGVDGGVQHEIVRQQYLDFCYALADAACVEPQCPSAAFPVETCLEMRRDVCDAEADRIAEEVTRGVLQLDQGMVAACVEDTRRQHLAGEAYRCAPVIDAEVFTAAFALIAEERCENDIALRVGTRRICARVFHGTIPVGGPCSHSDTCVGEYFGRCSVPDGTGCGTCEQADAELGAPCLVDVPGSGQRQLNCLNDGLCDPVSGLCVPQRAEGEECGAGIGACPNICRLYCERGDGGTGRCAPLPTEGEECRQALSLSDCDADRTCDDGTHVDCAPGFSCVLQDPAAAPDRGICRRQAEVGEPCSAGQDLDGRGILGFPDRSGSVGFYTLPTCVSEATCTAPNDGSEGTCIVAQPVPIGAECSDVPCDAREASCFPVDGELRCRARGTEGEHCFNLQDCEEGFYCDRSAPSPSSYQCRPYRGLGETCSGPARCHPPLMCVDGTCVEPALAVPPRPSCP